MRSHFEWSDKMFYYFRIKWLAGLCTQKGVDFVSFDSVMGDKWRYKCMVVVNTLTKSYETISTNTMHRSQTLIKKIG